MSAPRNAAPPDLGERLTRCASQHMVSAPFPAPYPLPSAPPCRAAANACTTARVAKNLPTISDIHTSCAHQHPCCSAHVACPVTQNFTSAAILPDVQVGGKESSSGKVKKSRMRDSFGPVCRRLLIQLLNGCVPVPLTRPDPDTPLDIALDIPRPPPFRRSRCPSEHQNGSARRRVLRVGGDQPRREAVRHPAQ